MKKIFLFYVLINLLLISITDTQAGRYGGSRSTGGRVTSPARSPHWTSSSSLASSSVNRPFSVSRSNGNSGNNRGRFSSIMKSLNNGMTKDVSSNRLTNGGVITGLPFASGKGTSGSMNSDLLSPPRPFTGGDLSPQLKGKSSKAKLAAAGLLGVPLFGSLAAGAYAVRHKSPYKYGRVVGSYDDDDDDNYYRNSYLRDDLQDASPSIDNNVPTTGQSIDSRDNEKTIEESIASSTTQPDKQVTTLNESTKGPDTVDTLTQPTRRSTVAIESGESHDLFGPARRGQKEELQGDHNTNPLLQLSNREYAAFNYPNEYDRVSPGRSTFGDVYFVAIVAGVGIASIFGVIGTGYCLYRINQHAKATADIEYPAYGVVGPITKDPPSTHSAYSSGNVSPTGDRKLAQTAQMYHYQHQKAAMMASASASRSSSAVPGKRLTSTSEGDSEEEADEIGYIVYECPGLAPTGEMEVKNPLFHDDSAPASPAKSSSSFPPKTPEGKSKADSVSKKPVTDEEDLK